MMIEALKNFSDKYGTDGKKFREEKRAIHSNGKLPDKYLGEWNMETEFLAIAICSKAEYMSVQYADEFINLMQDFVLLRFPLLIEVNDFTNAFDLCYRVFFTCISYIEKEHLEQSDIWKKFYQICDDNWRFTLNSMSESEQEFHFHIFFTELVDLFLSGNHKRINPDPYFHFLSLSWADSLRNRLYSEFEWLYSFSYDNKDYVYSILDEMEEKYFCDSIE